MNACYKLLQEHLDRESNVNERQNGTSASYKNSDNEDDTEQDYDWEEVYRAQREEQEKIEAMSPEELVQLDRLPTPSHAD